MIALVLTAVTLGASAAHAPPARAHHSLIRPPSVTMAPARSRPVMETRLSDLLTLRRQPKGTPWSRFTDAWAHKWDNVDVDHVARDMCLATTLQAIGEIAAELMRGYEPGNLDWHRIGIRAIAVGLWYATLYSRYLHAIDAVKEINPQLMGTSAGQTGKIVSTSLRTAIDNFVSTPLLYFPFIHLFTGVFLDHDSLAQCLQAYRHNWWQENEASCLLYIPAQIANFGLVPPKYRAVVLFSVDLCWAVVFAMLATPPPVEFAQSAMDVTDAAAAIAASVGDCGID